MSRHRFRVMLLLLAGIVAGVASASVDVLASLQADTSKASIHDRLNRVRADLFTRVDRFDQSVQELKAILALDPRSAEAHLLLGIAYRGLGSPDLIGEAVAEFRQALALEPALAPARLYLALVYMDLGRAERAREELEAGLVQAPGNPQFLAQLGEVERQLKNPRRSVDLLRQALAADESHLRARYYLGLALFDLGQPDEAIKELERVVHSGAKVADVYVSLGTGYLEAGRVDAALEILSQGTHLDPASPEMRIQLARAYRLKGQLQKADEQLTIAMPKAGATETPLYAQQRQAQFDLQLELGLLRLQQGRLEAAAEAFQKTLEMDPGHAAAKRHLADVKRRMQAKSQKKETGGRP
jgi:tetratricopeptide (TPR) repeat protein